METDPTPGMLDARRDMVEEASRIIDEARSRGIVLRLFGGLAVRTYCELAYPCERDYSDIDLIGLSRQVKGIYALFEALRVQGQHPRQSSHLGPAAAVLQALRASGRRAALLHPPRRPRGRVSRHVPHGPQSALGRAAGDRGLHRLAQRRAAHQTPGCPHGRQGRARRHQPAEPDAARRDRRTRRRKRGLHRASLRRRVGHVLRRPRQHRADARRPRPAR